MKKFVALLLTLIMVFALCACGNTTTTPEDKTPAAEESAAPAGNGDSAAASTPTTTDEAKAAGRKILVMNQHNSKESTNGQFTQYFVDYVNNNSDTLWIDVYYNGELGGIQETLEGAIMGTIDIGGCSFAQLATFYPEMEVWSMPYLYTDPYEGAKIVDLEKNTLLAEMIDKCNEVSGMTIFALNYSIDARQLTCNFPVSPPLTSRARRSAASPTPFTPCASRVWAALPSPSTGLRPSPL